MVAERGLEAVAGNRGTVVAVRNAISEGGVAKVSGNAIERMAKVGGKLAFAAHLAFAADEGREEYYACMEQ